MKLVSLLLITIPILTRSGAITKPPAINLKEIAGPYDGSSDDILELKFSRVYDGATITFTYTYIESGATFITSTFNKEDLSTESSFTLNYKLRVKDRLIPGGINLNIRVKNPEGKPSSHVDIPIYPKLKDTINGFDYVYENYEIKNRTFSISNSIVKNNIESFSFKNTVNTLELDDDNSLIISNIYFEYSFSKLIEDTTIEKYLRIKDDQKLFPYMNKDSGHYLYIPIKLLQEGPDINFGYNCELYVNPNTLEMSSTYRTGFTLTDRFYITPETFAKLQPSDITFVLHNVGMNDLTIMLPMTPSFGHNPIGLCHDSTYCFSGGVKK